MCDNFHIWTCDFRILTSLLFAFICMPLFGSLWGFFYSLPVIPCWGIFLTLSKADEPHRGKTAMPLSSCVTRSGSRSLWSPVHMKRSKTITRPNMLCSYDLNCTLRGTPTLSIGEWGWSCCRKCVCTCRCEHMHIPLLFVILWHFWFWSLSLLGAVSVNLLILTPSHCLSLVSWTFFMAYVLESVLYPFQLPGNLTSLLLALCPLLPIESPDFPSLSLSYAFFYQTPHLAQRTHFLLLP